MAAALHSPMYSKKATFDVAYACYAVIETLNTNRD